jgi:hypothetical protein
VTNPLEIILKITRHHTEKTYGSEVKLHALLTPVLDEGTGPKHLENYIFWELMPCSLVEIY